MMQDRLMVTAAFAAVVVSPLRGDRRCAASVVESIESARVAQLGHEAVRVARVFRGEAA